MIVHVQQSEDGEFFIHLPDEVIDATNLQMGDTIEWVDRGDGSFLIQKQNLESK